MFDLYITVVLLESRENAIIRNQIFFSIFSPILGSRGSFPSSGMVLSAESFSPPPVVGGNICDSF